MSNQLYEKVEEICKKIDLYAEKDISVKNQVKTKLYITKIKKLISMIEFSEANSYVRTMTTSENTYGSKELDEIEKNINNKEDNIKVINIYNGNSKNKNLIVKNKMKIWDKIKNIFKF